MAFAGLRGTGDWATDERPKNFREMILWRKPNGMAPLTALMAKMGSETTDDPEFAWWEEELTAQRVTLNGVMNTVSTTVVVVNSGALNLVPGDVLLAEAATDTATYELLKVNGVASDTTFDVIRGSAGTTAAAIANGAGLTKIGSVFSEGSTSPSVSNRNPTKLYNYTQIFKTAYEITRTAKKTRTRTGDPLKNDRKRRMFDHSVALELAFWFGVRNEALTGGSNGKPIRYTGGLRQFITTNRTIYGVATTEASFLTAVQNVFDYDTDAGNERLVMCGNSALMTVNKLAKAGLQLQATETVKLYGMELTKWVIPQGTFLFKTHPLFNTHARYTASMWVIDPSSVKYRYIDDTKMQDNIQANDADEQKGQWLTEAGLEVHHERTMAYLGNLN